ncbi:galactose ABC transporter substrate-binding protein [Clostridium sp. C105KSO13]|uniref:galactose ABC transporter substrate-binding protein n=1 Tax=Clostridium sp. C105KSO13 TaxID=1776045 RepID=UPI0007407F96|nr:galactose ABC transporter substrate-binding protein [Clostridium sp. C105KSO13]CUX36395.1 D-galactose-binding periplasmic protein precursor [Clostridium sp. C105KSO13]
MRRILGRLWMLAGMVILIVGMSVTSSGCIKRRDKEKEKNPIKIGVAIYRGDDAFISSVSSYLTSGGKALETKLRRKVVINIADAKNNQGSQNDQVDNFISRGYDIICVNMVDRTAAAVIADKAKEAHIPIIFFNREPVEEDMQIWDREYYVGTDAREAGILQGELLINEYERNPQKMDKNGDGKLQYVMLEGEQVHQDALIRTEFSVKTVLQAGIEMDKLGNETCNWMRSLSYEAMLKWLEDYGSSIEVVMSNNDEMALGAVQALREKDMLENGPVIVGIDGTKDCLEAISKGDIYGTVKNDAKKQAEVILTIGGACAEGKDPTSLVPELDGHYVRVPHFKVTKVNAGVLLKEE